MPRPRNKKIPLPKDTPDSSPVRSFNLARRYKRLLVIGIILIVVLSAAGFYWTKSRGNDQQTSSGYVDPATCSSCHAEIAENYKQTGMGRSFRKVSVGSQIADFTDKNSISHEPSHKAYRMTSHGGDLFMERSTTSPTGSYAMRIDYVVGSGNHARTFLHRTDDGKIIELPVSWYTELGGHWAMSPGYDRPGQMDFHRAIDKDCMSCHNGYPSADPVARDLSDGAVFAKELPEGIDCQRCHGPGAAHVKAAKAWWPKAETVRASIVNPSHLPRDRKMDVCRQCHLETTSSALPNSIRRYERDAYSFKPGAVLTDYELFFDRKPDPKFDDRFEVAHQAYRLEKSQCYLKSDMTCTTCHDPHKVRRGEAAVKQYVAVCEGCHQVAHPKVQGVAAVTPGSNCLTCHMWKRRTDDVVNVVMTDHFIQRVKPARDFTAALKEEIPTYQDEVVPYDRKLFSTLPEGELYTAVAQVSGDSNSDAGRQKLARDLEQQKPQKAGFYFALAGAEVRAGNDVDAVRWFQEALKRPDHSPATLRELASSLARVSLSPEAIQTAERAANDYPQDAVAQTNLGNIYLRAGRAQDAQQALQRALSISTENADANNLLGLALEQMHQPAQAQEMFRKAVQLNPDFHEAKTNLATSLADGGDINQATAMMQEVLAENPKSADVRKSYAMIFAKNRQYDKAIEQMKEAIQLRPSSASFVSDLAELLIAKGEINLAQKEYLRAIQIEPNQTKAHVGLAEILMAQNLLPQAEKEYQLAATASPRNGEVQLALAQLAARRGSALEVKEHLQAAAQGDDPAAREAAYKALMGR